MPQDPCSGTDIVPAMTAIRQLLHDLLHEADGLGDFVESHGNPRSDVSLGTHNFSGCQISVGIPRQVAAQIESLPAGTSRQSRQSELGGQSRRDHASANESVAQAGVLVVDHAQCFDLRSDRLDAIDQSGGAAARKVDARASRHDEVHEVALSQRVFGGAQQLFLEPRELGESDSKARVIAQRAEVAQVIRKTLQLQGKRSQPCCTRRYARSAHTFERLTIGPRECDSRIAGDPRGQPVAFEQGQLGESPLDALVHISEVLLEPENLFAHDGKAEMARLDDARMHRSDRNLVHALAFDRHKRVVIDGERGSLIGIAASLSGWKAAGHAAWRSHGR